MQITEKQTRDKDRTRVDQSFTTGAVQSLRESAMNSKDEDALVKNGRVPAMPAHASDSADSPTVPHNLDISEFFRLVRRFIPCALIDDAGWERLLDRIHDLPGQAMVSTLAGFEFRLIDAEPSADFGPMMLARSPLVEYYIDRGRAASADSRDAALGALLSRMSVDAWPTSASLEYDVWGVPDGQHPDPGLFLLASSNDRSREVPPLGEIVDILADALCMRRDDSERSTVQKVSEALPSAAFVYAVGAMPSRDLRAVRLTMGGIAPLDVPELLGRINWPGSIPLVVNTLDEILSVAPRFFITLDVAPHGPLPHIGLGVSPYIERSNVFNAWMHSKRSDWKPLIEHLVMRRLCLPHKGEAMMAFPGLNRLMGTLGTFTVYRAISYIKIVIGDDSVDAKSYGNMILFPVS